MTMEFYRFELLTFRDVMKTYKIGAASLQNGTCGTGTVLKLLGTVPGLSPYRFGVCAVLYGTYYFEDTVLEV